MVGGSGKTMQGADLLPVELNARDAPAGELLVQLSRQHFLGLKLASLRWVALASFPLWLEAQWGVLPDLVTWLALLAEGFGLGMAVVYTAVENRWARRGAQLEPNAARAVIHSIWTVWDELRLALWHGMAVVSLVPWIYVGFDRPLPTALLSALTATAATIFLLLVMAETVAQLRKARGSDRGPEGSGATSLG